MAFKISGILATAKLFVTMERIHLGRITKALMKMQD